MPIQKHSFSTGGMSVAQDLQSWSAQRQAEKTRKNIARSEEAGIAAGAAGEYAPKEAKFGIFGRDTVEAYNQGMRSAYIAGIDSDNINRINSIVATNPDNLQAYDSAVAGMLKGLSKEVDPEVRDLILQSAQQSADRARASVQRQEIAKNTIWKALARTF
jgi:hypothetical protein